MILYLIIALIILILLFFIYIRVKYKFWSLQPVFHFYDVYYWFKNVGVIRHELPEKNKYTNLKDIVTKNVEKLTDIEIKEFVSLIRLHYLRDKNINFHPNKENIMPYFTCNFAESYWSFYWEEELLLDSKRNKMIENKKLIGVITSKPLKVILNNGDNKAKMDVYYVDYLCIHKNNRKTGISPQLIQTHEYNQSHMNKKISVSMFKREGELTGIIPITNYKCFCFNVKKWSKPIELNQAINLLVGQAQNMYYLYNFIEDTKLKWDIIILPEMSNIIELVKTNNMYIRMLLYGQNIIAVYIYKKTCIYIEGENELLTCIASINGNVLTKEEFIQGFKICTWSILEKNKNFKYCSIEDISDNGVIISNIKIRTAAYMKTSMAYFFYNFAYNSFRSEKVLIIN
jgi:hypothetical protein